MKQVNITIGRFQPFTLGHLKCVEGPWQDRGLPTVIAMIETPDAKVDVKHPFPSSKLLPLYKKAFKNNEMIADVILVKNADIVKLGETLKNMGYEIASWSCGTDRIESYGKMASKYHDQAGLADDFEMYEVKRGDEDISATKVRAAIKADDIKTYKSMMPSFLHGDFDDFKKLLSQIKESIQGLSSWMHERIYE